MTMLPLLIAIQLGCESKAPTAGVTIESAQR